MTTTQKAELLRRMQMLDFEMRLRKYAPVLESDEERERDPRSDEQWALDEQYPSQRNF